jgi:hypothetical protein
VGLGLAGVQVAPGNEGSSHDHVRNDHAEAVVEAARATAEAESVLDDAQEFGRLHVLFRRCARRLRVLRETDPDYVLLDGTLAECERAGDSRADFSPKHRRHGVNVQVVTGSAGKLLWVSPALPGRTHDLTAARTHNLIRICERQGVPVLADRAYIGAGPLGDHAGQTPAPRRAHSHTADGQPSSVSSAGTRRTRCRKAEVLAGLPPSPMQPEPPLVNRCRRPHPGASALKKLSPCRAPPGHAAPERTQVRRGSRPSCSGRPRWSRSVAPW